MTGKTTRDLTASGAPASPTPDQRSLHEAEAAIPLVQVLGIDGRLLPGLELGLDHERLLLLYRAMVRVRVVDDRMLMLQRQGRIGFYGQATGQEASVIGSAAALERVDWVVPALREGGVATYRGYPLVRMIAQLAARDEEVSRGRQMPCHYTWREGNYVSMSSVIATQIPHATGIARAAQLLGHEVVVLCYLGDGATSESDFHCGLNFAAVWKAPVVFFCHNNQWAISVPFAKQTATRTIAIKARAYGIPGVRVDGNDVVAVFQETKKAVEHARAGRGPVLIEAVTYRRKGHSSSDDPTRYRSPEEVSSWEEKDPIERVKQFLVRENRWSKEPQERLEEEIHREISEAIRAIESQRDPSPESLMTDVFAARTPQQSEQLESLLGSIRSRATVGSSTKDGTRHG